MILGPDALAAVDLHEFAKVLAAMSRLVYLEDTQGPSRY